MKDKMRELAERWKGEYAGIADDELIQILDAEGDGGAAWWTTKDGAEPITSAKKTHMLSLGYPAYNVASWYNVPLYPHPARSGVVSDEDGAVVVTRNGDGDIVAVTRQNEEGQVLKVIALAPTVEERERYRTETKAIDAAIQGERHER